jgi:hypothetical protein
MTSALNPATASEDFRCPAKPARYSMEVVAGAEALG